MSEVILKDIVKIYPYQDKKEKKNSKTIAEKKTNLQITEKGVVAVQQFNLDIADGEFIVLVGPSGCGKSTTLRMVAGLEDISEGELYINGRLVNAVEPKDRDIAMVFQSYALYPHMTVLENMAYPLKIMPQQITFKFETEYLNYEIAKLNYQKEQNPSKASTYDKKIADLKDRLKDVLSYIDGKESPYATRLKEERAACQKKLEEVQKVVKEKVAALESQKEAVSSDSKKVFAIDKKISNENNKVDYLKRVLNEYDYAIEQSKNSYVAKMSKGMREYKVQVVAETLNITEYLDRKPKALSGGQRQRVAIGRAIVRNPKALLMDEPLSNLDAKLRNQMRAEIIKLRSIINTTFIYVTHDQTEAMTLGDRIVVMKDGFIQQVGTPQEVFEHPRNLFVAGFIGTPQMNYFAAKLIKEDSKYFVEYANGYKVELSQEKEERLLQNKVLSQDIILGVRPDHLNISSNEGLTGKVIVSELMGTSSHLHVTIDGKDVIVIVQNNGKYVNYMGQNLSFTYNGDIVHLFDPQTEKNLEYFTE